MTVQDFGTETNGAPRRTGAGDLQLGLGAWASAISMDDNAQAAIALAEAINRARQTQAGRENRAEDGRVISIGRLETMRARLAPIYAAIPRDVELFDLGMVGHDPPRLFVDIIAFIELAQDRRSFRLMQETRAGRILLGETTDEKEMAGLVTDYIAARLVERERALAAREMRGRAEPLPRATTLEQKAETVEAVASAGQATVSVAHAPKVAAVVAPTHAAQPVEPSAPPRPSPAILPSQAVATATAATMAARRSSGGWFWPLLALAIGIGLGALALYLYALSLNRV
jgi:hypothetical protein